MRQTESYARRRMQHDTVHNRGTRKVHRPCSGARWRSACRTTCAVVLSLHHDTTTPRHHTLCQQRTKCRVHTVRGNANKHMLPCALRRLCTRLRPHSGTPPASRGCGNALPGTWPVAPRQARAGAIGLSDRATVRTAVMDRLTQLNAAGRLTQLNTAEMSALRTSSPASRACAMRGLPALFALAACVLTSAASALYLVHIRPHQVPHASSAPQALLQAHVSVAALKRYG